MSVDIGAIKSAIKTIFDSANTTTGTPIDLSNNLSVRVQKVMKTNPEKIPIQPSFFPCVTVFTSDKSVTLQSTAINQVNGVREAEITFKIIGAFWNNNFSDVLSDPADDDLENLMENIEEILRSNEKLSNNVTWSFPSNIAYYSYPVNEETHLRTGVLDLQAKVWY